MHREETAVTKERALSESEITECTGARTSSADVYEVQLEGEWIRVDRPSYERVREIQDSCA
jgi:hypothetical protein